MDFFFQCAMEADVIKMSSYFGGAATVGTVGVGGMNACASTDLRSLVGMEVSLGPGVLQLLLQSFALCPPLAHGLLGPVLQFISAPRALLE